MNLALPFASKWNIFHYTETRIEQNPKDIKKPGPFLRRNFERFFAKIKIKEGPRELLSFYFLLFRRTHEF